MAKRFTVCMLLIAASLQGSGQVTTGSIGGMIRSSTGERMSGALIKAIHEPTGTAFFTLSSRSGIFYIGNLTPGGPYTIETSFLNYRTEKRMDLSVGLGEQTTIDVVLDQVSVQLKNVTVQGVRRPIPIDRMETVIDRDKMDALPSVGRNFTDYLLSVPQAKSVTGNEGAISLAGQNNRYNAFYIDGAVNNDVFGLTASGTNGGQAGISPLSIDAIEQFQVNISPYDASLGNFTGGAINAVTRSGTNKMQSSVYHYVSNNILRGQTASSTKTIDFSRRIYGMRMQGAFVKNKFFYFFNAELQREQYTRSFPLDEYGGDTKDAKIFSILANSLRSNQRYDAGSFSDAAEQIFADRIVARFDWNISARHILSLSARYTAGNRISSNMSDAYNIHFSNDGYSLQSKNISVSAEWKNRIGRRTHHTLLVTYSDVKDDRGSTGKPFPRVRIYDGNGSIVFGTDNSSTINLLTQKNWTMIDKWSFHTGQHTITAGIDAEYNRIYNAFIQNAFGNYSYGSVSDFLTNRSPSGYQVGFSLIDSVQGDHIDAAAKISLLRTAFFISDRDAVSSSVTLHYGMRIDKYVFLNTPTASDFVNDTAIPAFAKYYDVQGAVSGKRIQIPLSVSPRFGFTYRIPSRGIIVSGGAGIFSGRMPLAWPGGVYQYNGLFTGGYQLTGTQLNALRLRADPYNQWRASETGAIINKEPLNLTAVQLHMPSLMRVNISVEKKLAHNWSIAAELMFSKNLQEIAYTNLNLIPPVLQVNSADNRYVYTDSNKAKIPLQPDGSNPYDYVILLGNRSSDKGQTYAVTATIRKSINDTWRFEGSYHFNHATVGNEGTSSVNLSQWRTMESVNGRNTLTNSVSDFSAGHRIFAWFGRKFRFGSSKMTTTVSLTYSGQSGSPVSYVYSGNSMVRDDGKISGYELIYVPTTDQLSTMLFLPNTVNNTVFTPEQQKEALEEYISQDTYLRSKRGDYTKRNAGRTPFTHIVDLKLEQSFMIKINSQTYRIQLTCDLFNLGNLIKAAWGIRYAQPFDKIELIEFAGYTDPVGLVPQYRFNPFLLKPGGWQISRSSSPAYAAAWSCQLGLRFTF